MDGTSHDQRLDKRGKQFFSRAGFPPAAGLSVYLDVFGQAVARLAAAARPTTPVRMPETVFIFLSFLSPAEEGAGGCAVGGRRMGNSAAPQEAAGRRPRSSLPPSSRSMVPLTERAAAPPQNGALASCSVSALTDSVALEWQRVTANSRNGHLEEPLHQLRSRKNLRSVTKRRHIITSKWLKMQECLLKKGFYRCND